MRIFFWVLSPSELFVSGFSVLSVNVEQKGG